MKNWKDKVLGIFAGIGLMSLLMGFDQWEIDSGVRESNGGGSGGVYQFQSFYDSKRDAYIYLSMDSRTGVVYRWDSSNKRWSKRTTSMPSDIEVRY